MGSSIMECSVIQLFLDFCDLSAKETLPFPFNKALQQISN